jgi:hypothetical protein
MVTRRPDGFGLAGQGAQGNVACGKTWPLNNGSGRTQLHLGPPGEVKEVGAQFLDWL